MVKVAKLFLVLLGAAVIVFMLFLVTKFIVTW